MRKLILALCFFLAIVTYNRANADNLEFSALIASKHLGNEATDYNEFNPGLFVYRHQESYYQILGVYRNSFDKNSLFVGVGKNWFDKKICVEAGFVSGYENLVGGAHICTHVLIYGHRFKINATPGKAIGIAESDVLSIQYVF